jgi:superfamily II DNA/RNA helicase
VARGIDFKGVDMGMRVLAPPSPVSCLTGAVINFDMARDVKAHVHRIGRTARAGAQGQALTLAAASEMAMLADVEAQCKGVCDKTGGKERKADVI